MSMTDRRGQEAKEVWIGDGQGAVHVEAPPGCRMVLENEFHGDHDEDWIVCYGGDGKETARHQMRYVSTVIWK